MPNTATTHGMRQMRSIAIAMTHRKLTDIFLPPHTFYILSYPYHAGPSLKIKPTLDAK